MDNTGKVGRNTFRCEERDEHFRSISTLFPIRAQIVRGEQNRLAALMCSRARSNVLVSGGPAKVDRARKAKTFITPRLNEAGRGRAKWSVAVSAAPRLRPDCP